MKLLYFFFFFININIFLHTRLVDTRSLSEVSQMSNIIILVCFRSNWQFVAWFCAKLEFLCEVSQICWYDIVVLSQFVVCFCTKLIKYH